MSLRDQLLKAGLVSSEQAKKAENDAKKKRHQGKKDRRQGAEQAAKKAERERQQKAELEAKRERDRTLNREREAVKRRRENAARIRQLIKEHRANDPQAEIPYNFKAGKVVRRVRVTEPQRWASSALCATRTTSLIFRYCRASRQKSWRR